MRAFTDSKNRIWDLHIGLVVQRALYARHKYDIRQPDTIDRIIKDPVFFTDILTAVCERQTRERELTADSFLDSLTVEDIEGIGLELIEAVLDFFPPRQREIMRTAMQKVKAKARQAQERASKLATDKLNSPEMDALIDQEMDKLLAKATKAIDSPLVGTSTGN